MSDNAQVGMQGFAPEVLISNEDFSAMAPREQRRIRERNRRFRLMETLKKLRAKVEAGARNAEAYKARITDIEEDLGFAPGEEG